MKLEGKKILLTGGAGFLGRFVVDELIRAGVRRADIRIPRREQSDLRLKEACRTSVEGMDVVIHLAATVGGIGYNRRHPADLFYDNVVMGAHLLDAAMRTGVEKFVQVGTVCAYPKRTPVPFREEDLWNGYPEETNAPYGIAKKALLVMARAYRAQYGLNTIYLLPANLYGPGDNFDLEDSHVVPALIRRCLEAREAGHASVTVWGSGSPTREFLYVEDCARGIVLATRSFNGDQPVNLGSGQEISIRELLATIVTITGFEGEIVWDRAQPDGQPRRCLDTSKARDLFGFEARIPLEEGLRRTVDWYREQREILT